MCVPNIRAAMAATEEPPYMCVPLFIVAASGVVMLAPFGSALPVRNSARY